MKLDKRVAIITGGGSGIGRATALLFAKEGASVAIIDRDEAGAAGTVRLVAAGGGKAMLRIGDVGKLGTAEADAAAILSAWGSIDVLMTAAGFSCGGTVTTTDPADWDAVVNVNIGGTWLWARAVIPAMQAQKKGSIITVGSQLAIAGGRGSSAYIAAKGAILSLTRTMSRLRGRWHSRQRTRPRCCGDTAARARIQTPSRSGGGERGIARSSRDAAFRQA